MPQESPDKIIEIPNVGRIAFPGSMSPEAINAAASKLYREKNPTHPTPAQDHSWLETAVDWLPTAGGVIGGLAGGVVGGPLGAIGGAAMGGAAGEGYKRSARALQGRGVAPSMLDDVSGMATQAALQGGAEAVGAGLGVVMKPAARALMQSAVKPSLKLAKSAILRGETPPVVETLLKEGINVTPRGVEKLSAIIQATDDEISQAIQGVTGQVHPLKVTRRLGETAQRFATQVNPASDLEAVSRVGQEFLETQGPMSVQAAQELKRGTYKQLAGKYGELKGAEIEAQKALARGLKEEIEAEVRGSLPGIKGQLGLPGGVDITAANARQGAAMTARDAVARRIATTGNRDLMGLAGLAVSHPLTFLTVMFDRSPAVKSLIARGLYAEAGKVAKVSPQVIRVAVQSLASASDEEPR